MKVELLGGLNSLTELSKEEKLAIKNDLTIENPKYKQAKAYGRGYTSASPNLFFFKSVGKALVVPRGYKVPFNADKIVDSRVSVNVEYPKLNIKLRDTQEEAYLAWDKNRENGAIVLPTGKGKSILGAYLAYATRQRSLIIVQKLDLADGWKQDIMTMFPNLSPKDIGIIKGGKHRLGSQYTIATIQSLINLPSDELSKLFSTFGMIIIDEFHHSPAKSYDVLKYFKSKYYIGLTATDMREDGLQQVLYWTCGNVCYRHEETENDEDIMPYKVVLRQSNIHYNPPQKYTKGGRRIPISSAELRKVIANSDDFNRLVANDIKSEYAKNKSCIAFFHEKEHIHTMERLLEQIGVPMEQIQLYCSDAKEKDSVMKKKAESKEVLITLATFAKATEGTNVKAWERAFLVTSLNNEKSVIQAVGRIRRRKEGKKDAIVYDYAHPYMKSVRNHIYTRMRAYKKTKATFSKCTSAKNLVSRGWYSITK